MSKQESGQWGNWYDPDTERGLREYKAQGLTLTLPETHRNSNTLKATTEACSELFASAYEGHYPLASNDAETLQQRVKDGSTHLFTLSDQDRVIATAAVVEKENPLGYLQFAELGRACGDEAAGVSLRALLKARVGWALKNIPDLDMLYSVTRTNGEDGAFSSGKKVQSVWWGSRRDPSATSALITGTSTYDYRLEKTEPFNTFFMPAQPDAWREAVHHTNVFLPTEEDADALRTIFSEATGGTVRPNIHVDSSAPAPEDFRLTMLDAPSERSGASYAVTPNGNRSLSDIEQEFKDGVLSQKIAIEAATTGTPEGAAILRQLRESGWTLAGWQPSLIAQGALCPVMTRLHPEAAKTAARPKMHKEYFDNLGLAGTREILENTYTTIHRNVGAAGLSLATYTR